MVLLRPSSNCVPFLPSNNLWFCFDHHPIAYRFCALAAIYSAISWMKCLWGKPAPKCIRFRWTDRQTTWLELHSQCKTKDNIEQNETQSKDCLSRILCNGKAEKISARFFFWTENDRTFKIYDRFCICFHTNLATLLSPENIAKRVRTCSKHRKNKSIRAKGGRWAGLERWRV